MSQRHYEIEYRYPDFEPDEPWYRDADRFQRKQDALYSARQWRRSEQGLKVRIISVVTIRTVVR